MFLSVVCCSLFVHRLLIVVCCRMCFVRELLCVVCGLVSMCLFIAYIVACCVLVVVCYGLSSSCVV